VLAAAFAAGCRWASIREKDFSSEEQIAVAQQLVPLARQHGALLTLHGDPELAREAELDGAHLAASGNLQNARKLLGSDALIGISIHTPEEAGELDPAIVDYAIAGPAYETSSKPGYRPVLGLAGITAIAAVSPVPIIAIGGITLGLIDEMRTAGATGVAVMGSVMRAHDPAEEVRALVAAMAGRQA